MPEPDFLITFPGSYLPMRKFLCLLVFLSTCNTHAQDSMSGTQLLENAIQYHDPEGKWAKFYGQLMISAERPGETERITRVLLNLPAGYFEVSANKDGEEITYTIDKGACTPSLNGKAAISKEDAVTHAIDCNRGITMKNFYSYLYGLPMKLKDSGTIIYPKVVRREFHGKTSLVLKITYEPTVGTDSWYFYFDPETFALQAYQFYHDEAKNDGEYILLEGETMVSGIKIPKIRAWYNNKDNAYLGSDTITDGFAL